jgi:hypothetical protein
MQTLRRGRLELCTRHRRRERTRHRRRERRRQHGGLLGHVTGFHLSERGIRHILMGNHRVKKRYTERLRGLCKEFPLYTPGNKYYSDPKMQEAYNKLRKDSSPANSDQSLLCGFTGPILKNSSYRPDGSQYISEGFQSAMKRYTNSFF